jgi:recombinational DNA repair ATPase RecF
MSVKINKIEIDGIRGIQSKLELNLNGKSIVLYGDNGTGKSSISDSIEWFYTNKVSHLSSNEIDLKDALRNINKNEEVNSYVSLSYVKLSTLDGERKLTSKKGKLNVELSNTTDPFKEYLLKSESENLLLRYQYLTDFIDNTKSEKLTYLSNIIGYSEVTKKKEILRKSYTSLASEIKAQNFEAQLNAQKGVLIEKLGAAISQKINLFETIEEKIKPLNLQIKIDSFEKINEVLEFLKASSDQQIHEELSLLEKVKLFSNTIISESQLINSSYLAFSDEFKKVSQDVNSIMQTFFADFIKSGTHLINKFHKEDSCPFCLQSKNIEQLKAELSERLKEIEASSEKLNTFKKAQLDSSAIADERIKRIEALLLDKLIDADTNSAIKNALEALKNKFNDYKKGSTEKVTSGNPIPSIESVKLSEADFTFLDSVNFRIKSIQEALKKVNKTELYSNISSSKDAFLKIKQIEKSKDLIEKQRKSLEIIYNAFVKAQKEGLENFITTFSTRINEFYQFMNPDEPFQEIKIVTIGDEDELNGITIEYKYNGKWVSPPQKYFSESHLNCFGISFFLASVEAFNKLNKFFVLDDVISSFDSAHRKRFAELIFAKFSDYQIILLTHEEDWFTNFVRPLAKNRQWIINEINWTESKGTHIKEEPKDLSHRIEEGLASGNISDLGNPIRKYLEFILKEIALNTESKYAFQFNEANEHRMPNELLQGLRSQIKLNSKELQDKFEVFDRVEQSALLGNICSHDNPFNPSIHDLKAFWADVNELINLFYCQQESCTKKSVSMKYYDNVAKKIRCGCGETKYDWKKN